MGHSVVKNRLANEKSPYLKQHATNPVDWHAWNEEAWAHAKKIDKPIFLSIGYSTCHWCHVMAHESFENGKIAELLNRHFVNIKVDREERPDVDAIYMTAVQALTGSGGWPMSVWLTPDLKPFFAGTYFPPEDRYGRPGFPSVITQIAEIWEKDRSRILESADQITDLLKQYTSSSNGNKTPVDAKELNENVYRTIKAQYDPENGGFGPAPKFPMPVYLDFLLGYAQRTSSKEAREMVESTMEKMSTGGLYDHLGGGFARYSTDDKWIVPHFEKMLYDNAQLITVISKLFEQTGDAKWKQLADHTITYVLRDLRSPDGAFYSAEDADSEGKEGAFYLWTLHEIKKVLSTDEAEALIKRYGVTAEGNFMDPHTRETGKNILVKKGVVTNPESLALAEKMLLSIRERRPRPHRDEKILTEWNGLMISALAQAGAKLKEPHYTEAASKATDFLRASLYDPKTKQVYRSWCAGERSIEGQQVDYAMLVQALLDLADAAGEDSWISWALELQETQDRLFFDAELGGYFMNVPRPDLLIRMKDDNDNVIPSGNSIAIRNGFRLAKKAGRSEFLNRARKSVEAFSGRIKSNPASISKLVSALSEATDNGQL